MENRQVLGHADLATRRDFVVKGENAQGVRIGHRPAIWLSNALTKPVAGLASSVARFSSGEPKKRARAASDGVER